MNHLAYLKQAHLKSKLSHAYLLSGNDKQGKERLLEEFLHFLLGPLGTRVHADVVRVSPQESEITIGQIRNLQERLALSPWVLPFKVGILTRAETMNQEAQSAFLKLLEEPKGNTLLFLDVPHAGLLLDTIRSRAQELRMYRFLPKDRGASAVFSKLKAATLAERFSFAERQSQDSQALHAALLELQRGARAQLLSELKEGKHGSTRLMRVFQEVLILLRQTQVNRRYAAERILLEF